MTFEFFNFHFKSKRDIRSKLYQTYNDLWIRMCVCSFHSYCIDPSEKIVPVSHYLLDLFNFKVANCAFCTTTCISVSTNFTFTCHEWERVIYVEKCNNQIQNYTPVWQKKCSNKCNSRKQYECLHIPTILASLSQLNRADSRSSIHHWGIYSSSAEAKNWSMASAQGEIFATNKRDLWSRMIPQHDFLTWNTWTWAYRTFFFLMLLTWVVHTIMVAMCNVNYCCPEETMDIQSEFAV